ncbi:hypothetical protein [Fulvimarina sp. MAC3]|uniref:hypothetical protein n=1 Tax=Fulvimarina sp. MAC3 TaxID=3148887 RepID=UPI0031FDD2A9
MSSEKTSIEFRKTAREPVELKFDCLPIRHQQRRLIAREFLKPEVDLKAFKKRALIDYVVLGAILPAPTQWLHIKREIDSALGVNCRVDLQPENETEEATNTGKIFTVRLQEPSIAQIIECEAAILRARRLEIPLVVEKLEISVDFYSTSSNPGDDRIRLLGALERCFWPGRDHLVSVRDWPRFSWGGSRETRHVLPLGRARRVNPNLLSVSERDRPPVGDATFYVGSQSSRASWRMMEKLIDKQNLAAGTVKVLSDAEKRVRMEVTLGMSELQKLDLATVEDFRRFRFEDLRKPYFDFKLPTFQIPRTGSFAATKRWLERNRKLKFLKAGVIGLRMLDEVTAANRKSRRPDIIRALKQEGRKIRSLQRSGSGDELTFLAYEELNKAFEVALASLSKREKRLLS